ncbi:hypothetical protein R3W88_031845 [Solanum pinnatisectum]|uniref:Uncharacterized protein n=1 Tax=Solanum pinnatisectum TaxID=50273 RepID=A0AAV9LNI2_9SOLN|nr:hypothetical protein R3W88_031845 [Solanum pinnatisectum]
MAGLDDSIKLDVQLLKPPDLSTAMSVARALEQNQQLQKGQQSQTSLGSTVNLEKYAMSSVDSFNTKTSNQTPLVKRLNRAEMAERRA